MDIGGTSTTAKAAGSPASTPATNPALEKAAHAFEAIFLRQMIGAMRSASLADGMFDSSATQQFQDLADSNVADNMAKNSKFGIADLLIRQFAPKVPLTTATAMKPEFTVGSGEGAGK